MTTTHSTQPFALIGWTVENRAYYDLFETVEEAYAVGEILLEKGWPIVTVSYPEYAERIAKPLSAILD